MPRAYKQVYERIKRDENDFLTGNPKTPDLAGQWLSFCFSALGWTLREGNKKKRQRETQVEGTGGYGVRCT
jgi:hypothetical protein